MKISNNNENIDNISENNVINEDHNIAIEDAIKDNNYTNENNDVSVDNENDDVSAFD